MYSGVNCEIESAQRKVAQTVTSTATVVAMFFIGSFFLIVFISDMTCICTWFGARNLKRRKKNKKSHIRRLVYIN